jgi:hypothetical protein
MEPAGFKDPGAAGVMPGRGLKHPEKIGIINVTDRLYGAIP